MEFELDLDKQIILSMSVKEEKKILPRLYYPEIDNLNYSFRKIVTALL